MIVDGAKRLWTPEAAAGPVTLDYVRDGGFATWVGPANPSRVMLFQSSGLDWYNATDYQPTLYNGAVWKTGVDGGLDLPQATPGIENVDVAEFIGLSLIRVHTDGPFSFIIVLTHRGVNLASVFETFCSFQLDTTNRLNFDSTRTFFKLGTSTPSWPGFHLNNSPQKAAIGCRYQPGEPFATRGKLYTNGITEAQESLYFPSAFDILAIGNGSLPSGSWDFRWDGTAHAVFTWDYEITEQEMLDATANPDSLFAAA